MTQLQEGAIGAYTEPKFYEKAAEGLLPFVTTTASGDRVIWAETAEEAEELHEVAHGHSENEALYVPVRLGELPEGYKLPDDETTTDEHPEEIA